LFKVCLSHRIKAVTSLARELGLGGRNVTNVRMTSEQLLESAVNAVQLIIQSALSNVKSVDAIGLSRKSIVEN
jgi:DNA-binding Xre family transcriptional regulator